MALQNSVRRKRLRKGRYFESVLLLIHLIQLSFFNTILYNIEKGVVRAKCNASVKYALDIRLE